MAIDPQLTDFMPDTVTINPQSSRNNYGEETYSGATRTAKAWVEPNTHVGRTDQVHDQSQPTQAYIADTTLTAQDKITLPDGTTPEISTVQRYTAVTGLEHTVVTFL